MEAQGLWRNDLFKQVVQAVLELAKPGTDERATLEYVQNHLATDGGVVVPRQRLGHSDGCWRSSGTHAGLQSTALHNHGNRSCGRMGAMRGNSTMELRCYA